MNSSVSVVIPAYNSSGTIAGAVESAWDQTVAPLEVIVVDDSSSDRARLLEVLEPWMSTDRVTVLHMEQNLGPAAARNRGIAVSSGEFIALLDADDRFERERIEAALQVFKQHPDTAMTCSETYVVQNDAMLPGLKNDQWKPIGAIIGFERLLMHNCIYTLTVTIRRDVYDRFGPFDEDLRLVAVEDYDLWLRVGLERKIRYIDRPLCRYTVSPGSLSADPYRLFNGVAAILEKLERDVPGFMDRFGSIARRRRHAMRLDLAYDLYAKGDKAGARREAWQAIRETPLSPKPYRLFLKASIGL